jgi:hypothetical protein
MTIKQKEFLKEFEDLLLKYNAEIGWTCDECSDTHGLYNDLDELYKRAKMGVNNK